MEIELPSEIKEEQGIISFEEKDEGSSILFKTRGYFSLNFYDRINPKTVTDFFILVQE